MFEKFFHQNKAKDIDSKETTKETLDCLKRNLHSSVQSSTLQCVKNNNEFSTTYPYNFVLRYAGALTTKIFGKTNNDGTIISTHPVNINSVSEALIRTSKNDKAANGYPKNVIITENENTIFTDDARTNFYNLPVTFSGSNLYIGTYKSSGLEKNTELLNQGIERSIYGYILYNRCKNLVNEMSQYKDYNLSVNPSLTFNCNPRSEYVLWDLRKKDTYIMYGMKFINEVKKCADGQFTNLEKMAVMYFTDTKDFSVNYDRILLTNYNKLFPKLFSNPTQSEMREIEKALKNQAISSLNLRKKKESNNFQTANTYSKQPSPSTPNKYNAPKKTEYISPEPNYDEIRARIWEFCTPDHLIKQYIMLNTREPANRQDWINFLEMHHIDTCGFPLPENEEKKITNNTSSSSYSSNKNNYDNENRDDDANTDEY